MVGLDSEFFEIAECKVFIYSQKQVESLTNGLVFLIMIIDKYKCGYGNYWYWLICGFPHC